MFGFQMRIENVRGWRAAFPKPVEQSPDQRGLAGASFTSEENNSLARSNPILNRLPSFLNPGSHEQIARIWAYREGVLLEPKETKKAKVRISAQAPSSYGIVIMT